MIVQDNQKKLLCMHSNFGDDRIYFTSLLADEIKVSIIS